MIAKKRISSSALTKLEKSLRAYAQAELRSLRNSEQSIDDFIVEMIAHIATRSVVGDVAEFTKNTMNDYKYSYKSNRDFYHKLSGTAHDARPDKLLEGTDSLTSLLKHETTAVKILLRGFLLHPEKIHVFMKQASIPIEERVRISLYLEDISKISVCIPTPEFTMSIRDHRKALLLQYLYEKNPAMLVLLLKMQSTGKFIDTCRMFSGQTITFPDIAEVEEAVHEATRTVKVKDAFNALLDRVEISDENALPLQAFVESSIKVLLEQSSGTLEELQENLDKLDAQTLLRLYTTLGSSFTKTTALANTLLNKDSHAT